MSSSTLLPGAASIDLHRPAIELNGLTKVFRSRAEGEIQAVAGVDLQIGHGEIVALLGPNGAGKTTMIDMILGLTSPTRGQVQVCGTGPRQAVQAGLVSALLQSGGLLQDLSVRETMQVVAGLFGRLSQVDQVLERTGLTPLARRRVSKCSGGEQQRIRFALALLPDPRILVLDEPTAGMDVNARQEFWRTMRTEAADGRTVVFATHYLHEAEEYAERILLLVDGQLIADGATAQIRAIAGVRRLTVTVTDPAAATRRLEEMGAQVKPGTGNSLIVHAAASDEVARVVLTELGGRDLEIVMPSLDDAFTLLTASPRAGSPAKD